MELTTKGQSYYITQKTNIEIKVSCAEPTIYNTSKLGVL
jgi:hypothetical protein